MHKLFLIQQIPRKLHTHTLLLLFGGGVMGGVSKLIITIHSKDDLPRPSHSSPRWRRCGLGLPRPLMKFRGLGPPGTACAATSAALAHAQGNRSGLLINASPMSYPFQLLPVHGQAL